MSRIFRAHELKHAVLEVLHEHGPANGYALMRILGDRIGPTWRPSPGAIYPALLALEDLGLIGSSEAGGSRSYHLEAAGQAAVAQTTGTIDRAAERARSIERHTELGTLLDRFAATSPSRHRRVDAGTEGRILAVLARTADDLDAVMTPLEEQP